MGLASKLKSAEPQPASAPSLTATSAPPPVASYVPQTPDHQAMRQRAGNHPLYPSLAPEARPTSAYAAYDAYRAQPQQPAYQAQQQHPPAANPLHPAPQPDAHGSFAYGAAYRAPPEFASKYGAHAGAAAPQAAPAPGPFSAQAIQAHLQRIVGENRLEAFYPPARLLQVAQRVAAIDLLALAARWRLNTEIVMDLTPLALYDIAIYADDSGSMEFEEGGERIDDLKAIMAQVAEVVTLFDDDGILMTFMNSNIQESVCDAAGAAATLAKVSFAGLTPLGTALDRKLIQPLVLGPARNGTLPKPVLVIAITDGEPVGEPRTALVDVIKKAKADLNMTPCGSGALALQLAQVGKDTRAQRFLGEVDVHPEVGHMVDATSYFELEAEEFASKGVTLTPQLYLVKLMVGAIDRTYDESDEVEPPPRNPVRAAAAKVKSWF